jgi:hypothetical protein
MLFTFIIKYGGLNWKFKDRLFDALEDNSFAKDQRKILAVFLCSSMALTG